MKKKEKVQVWICSGEGDGFRVLLLKTIPERGGHWLPVTGFVEAGETFEEAAVREAREETGFSFEGPLVDLCYSHEFEGRWGRAEEHAFALVVGPPSLRPILDPPVLDPKEHVEYRWERADDVLTYLPAAFEGVRKGFEALSLYFFTPN